MRTENRRTVRGGSKRRQRKSSREQLVERSIRFRVGLDGFPAVIRGSAPQAKQSGRTQTGGNESGTAERLSLSLGFETKAFLFGKPGGNLEPFFAAGCQEGRRA